MSLSQELEQLIVQGLTDGIGYGSLTQPITTATASERCLEVYTENTATSGSSKGLYWGHHVAGAGQSGAAGDFYGWADGVAAVGLSGLHASIFFTDGGDGVGSVTGLAAAIYGSMVIPNAALPAGGTYCGGQSEINADGADSDISAVTNHAIHRFVLGGDATGKATASVVLEFAGLTEGTAADDMLKTDKHAGDSTDGLRCIVNGDVKYIMLAD